MYLCIYVQRKWRKEFKSDCLFLPHFLSVTCLLQMNWLHSSNVPAWDPLRSVTFCMTAGSMQQNTSEGPGIKDIRM